MDIIEFDPGKYHLGVLCKLGHEWQDTGKTLRKNNDSHCPQCNTINQRIRKPPKVRPTLEQRFWERVDKSGDCWDWLGSKNVGGYGQIRIKGTSKPCHRVAWELTYGEIPEGLKVLHVVCDRPSCCNPAHLQIGTQADNVADMIAKNRAHKARGAQQWCSKLTEEQVKEIKVLGRQGIFTRTAIANQYGVSVQVISGILNGKGWKHVD